MVISYGSTSFTDHGIVLRSKLITVLIKTLFQSAVSTQMSQGTPSTPQHQQQRATGTTVIRQPQQQQQQQPQLPTQPLPLQSAASAVSQQQQTQQQLHAQMQAAAPGARIVLPTEPIPQSRVSLHLKNISF